MILINSTTVIDICHFINLNLLFAVVPAQIESMVGSKHKGRWLGGMVAGGAGKCRAIVNAFIMLGYMSLFNTCK